MHPILIPIGDSFFIPSYGVMIALGVVVALLVASWRAKRVGVPSDDLYDLTTVAVLSGLLGGRVFFILQNWDDFLKAPAAMLFARDGFVFLGGLIGGIGSSWWFLRRRKIEPWVMGDLVAVGLPIAHAFGRIGCHLSGCCFGRECRPGWLAITLKPEQRPDGELFYNAYLDQLLRDTIGPEAAESLPVYAVQLMESVGLFALAATIAAIFWRKSGHPGAAFAAYLMGYSILRFSLEFLRGDLARGVYFGGLASTSQLISLGVFAGGAVLLAKRLKAPLVEFAPKA
ncbi:MAG: prolipoprotein diacylglyceryl transferase [Candidatus Sumerlaeia bacterium]|nr:prolipoprotein diacylglyceryl transferase [Candidatus Sumerlaeia bacterium]